MDVPIDLPPNREKAIPMIMIIPCCIQRITRRQGGGDEAYNLKVTRYKYVEEADNAANKVSV